MAERLKEIFSLLPECESFADVGCDHGYIAEAMLKSGKCKRAVMSDVSEKCLEKAKKLNAEFIKNGVAEAVLGALTGFAICRPLAKHLRTMN